MTAKPSDDAAAANAAPARNLFLPRRRMNEVPVIIGILLLKNEKALCASPVEASLRYAGKAAKAWADGLKIVKNLRRL